MKIRLPEVAPLRDPNNPNRNSEARLARVEIKSALDELAIRCNAEGRNPAADEARSAEAANRLLRELDEIVMGSEVDYDSIPDARGGGHDAWANGPQTYREGVPLTRSQSVEGYVRSRRLVHEGEENLDLRKYLRGIATGDWQDADAERRAMSEGTNTAGGFLLPTILSSQIIDLVRNQTRVLQAGATIVPMENRTVDVAKWASDPTAAWHSENAAIAPSDATIGKLTLTAQALASNVEVSWELLEDAPGVVDKLQEAFAKAFALKLDLAALYGTGTAPEPRGVKNTAGISTASMGANGATLTSWDTLVDAVGRLQDQNEDPNGIIYAGRTARNLSKLKDTTNQPLQPPEALSGIPRYSTLQVPVNLTQGTSSLASDIFTGDWSQLLVGVRTRLMVKVLDERYSDLGQIGFIAWWRGDTAVARPKAFDVLTGVR